MKDSSLLIIDRGHSRLKFHHYQKGEALHQVMDIRPFKWPEQKPFLNWDESLHIGTNESIGVRLCSHIKNLNQPAPMILGKDIRVPISAQNIHGAGNDRLACALGAQQLYPNKRCMIISAGTALVTDTLCNQGRFQGGSIGIGYGAYCKSMLEINPLLKSDSQSPAQFPAHNTESAVWLGWFEPAFQHIQAIIKSFAPEKILITGGDANLFMAKFHKLEHHPNLAANAMARELGYLN